MQSLLGLFLESNERLPCYSVRWGLAALARKVFNMILLLQAGPQRWGTEASRLVPSETFCLISAALDRVP